MSYLEFPCLKDKRVGISKKLCPSLPFFMHKLVKTLINMHSQESGPIKNPKKYWYRNVEISSKNKV